mmetsp:Transcript_36998/g.87914  ORF Transcript_36998/g.87914 Transcript_36998/m.87914 type:complete len:191 (+) Transcript_36998:86-658(+)
MAKVSSVLNRFHVGGQQACRAVRPSAPRIAASRIRNLSLSVSFEGLSIANRLGLRAQNETPFSQVSNGAKVFAMRHRKRVARLGRPADQRKALIRGLVTDVLKYGSITTTKPKAKAIRKYVDKMVQLSKRGTLHARRQALAFIYDKEVVSTLFEEGPKRYSDREGGYCRVINEPVGRRGDNAPMATIELV